MKTIAIWNRKGGTGKTTTTGNTGAYLADHGKVLLIDSDPQGNLTSWLAKNPQIELADVLQGSSALQEAIIPIGANLDIVPTFSIGGDLNTFAETRLPSLPFAFVDFQEQVQALGYDYLMYDMAPGDSILQRAILATANEVLLVATPEYFASDGLEAAMAILEEVKKTRRATYHVKKMVINRINKAYASHDVYLENFGQSDFELYAIGQNTRIHDAVMFHGTIKEWDPGNKFAPIFQSLAGALI
jgi:chromosome partitioning protein